MQHPGMKADVKRTTIPPMALLLLLLSLLLLLPSTNALQQQQQQQSRPITMTTKTATTSLESVKNLRPVVHNGAATTTPPIYRSATLDDLTMEDAQCLLDGSFTTSSSSNCMKPLAAIIDLRNVDEIQKGIQKRSDGSHYFYSQLTLEQDINTPSFSKKPILYHRPLLHNPDKFWDTLIEKHMDPIDRIKATIQTTFVAGALDKAAAQHLETQGLGLLYQIMMTTSTEMIGQTLQCIIDTDGPIIFHCQKGKDRTGVIAMLLQSILNATDEEILQSYQLSEQLLGEKESRNQNSSSDKARRSSSSSTMVDWNHLRGSPRYAMEDTLLWTRKNYGSISNYVTKECGIDIQEFRSRLLLQQNEN